MLSWSQGCCTETLRIWSLSLTNQHDFFSFTVMTSRLFLFIWLFIPFAHFFSLSSLLLFCSVFLSHSLWGCLSLSSSCHPTPDSRSLSLCCRGDSGWRDRHGDNNERQVNAASLRRSLIRAKRGMKERPDFHLAFGANLKWIKRPHCSVNSVHYVYPWTQLAATSEIVAD